jgi:hypothetical protein
MGPHPQDGVGGNLERQSGPTPGAAATVEGLVSHNTKQPGSKLGSCPKATQRLIGLHEGNLRCVLGLESVAKDEVRNPQSDALVGADEIGVSRHISVLGLFDQAFFIQWTALHRQVHLRYTAVSRKVPRNL